MRAIGVLLVVLYHLWPGRLPGGYIGVDVFFVISGFLITAHLLREIASTGRVGLAAFWARRARRLLPAAYLVLATTALGVALWVPRLYWQQFFKEIGAATLYVENWSLAHDSVDYLAQSNNPSPTQHYWTLSAEEQFYLAWPVLIVFALGLGSLLRSRARHRTPRANGPLGVLLVVAAATAASLVYSLHETTANPSAAYFITTTRAWEFGAGAVLACVSTQPLRTKARLRACASWVGLGVLGCLGFRLSDLTPMPGTAAIVVVLATVAVIAAGHPTVSWSPTRLLALRPVQFVGDISYSMYLWHWPLIVLAPYMIGHSLGFAPRVGILVATLVLAVLTKRLVEDPVRTGRRFKLRTPAVSFGWAAVGATIIVAICSFGLATAAHEQTHDKAIARRVAAAPPRCFGAASVAPDATGCPDPKLASVVIPSPAAARTDYPHFPTCDGSSDPANLTTVCTFGDAADRRIPHIAVIGDSHAGVLMSGLQQLVKQKKITADLFASGGCDWATGPPPIATKSLRNACTSLRGRVQHTLRQSPTAYDFVVTTSWVGLLRGDHTARVESIAAAWAPVARAGVPIVAVRDNPFGGRTAATDPNLCMSQVAAAAANQRCSLLRSKNLDNTFDPYRPAVDRTPGAHYIDMTAFYCTGNTCPAVIGGVNVYRDNSHLTTTFMQTLAPYLYRAFQDAGVL